MKANITAQVPHHAPVATPLMTAAVALPLILFLLALVGNLCIIRFGPSADPLCRLDRVQ